MGPKKDTGKPKARLKAPKTVKSPKTSKSTRVLKPASGKLKLEKVETPKRVKSAAKNAAKSDAKTNNDTPRGATKKGAKKPSLILSLQSSPAIKDRTGKKEGSTQQPPLMRSIPKLHYENNERKYRPLVESSADGSLAFIEPELAPPKPGISGHTLESLPPAKAKRGAANGGSGGRWRKNKAASAQNFIEPPSDEQIEKREAGYRKHLETGKLELLTDESGIRSETKAPTRKRERLARKQQMTTTIEIPPTPTSLNKSQGSPGSISVKRIKIISPKRSNALLGTNAVSTPPAEPSDPNDNDDFCFTCGGTGVFICCDSCPKSLHLLCCDPPLRDVPEDNWNCNECMARLGHTDRKVWNDLGMFGPLVNSIFGRNPTEFRLPKRLRNDTFIGVTTGENHAYADTLVKPEISYTKANGAQIPGFNKDESLDIDDLYDKEGNPYLCHKCGLSGLHRRTLTFCDYCPLLWHLDCLPMPMCLAKTRGQKWRCPNHVELLLPTFWQERRSFKDALVLDAAAHNNFLRFFLASNFLVKHTDQPYLAGGKDQVLEKYQQFQNRNFFSADTEAIDKWTKEYEASPDPEDETESGVNVTPDYLQNYSTNDLIVAKTGGALTRLLLMTNADDPAQTPFIYRVPEQQLLLDFVLSAKNKKRAILKDIDTYDAKIHHEHTRDLDAVKALLTIHNGTNDNGTNEDCTNNVVQSGEPLKNGFKFQENPAAIPIANPIANSHPAPPGNISISASELDELQQIRRLLQAKGKDAVAQFLAS